MPALVACGIGVKMTDDRRVVAIYAIVRTERDGLALSLMHYFCVQSGWRAIAYIDKTFPKGNGGDAWDRLLDDIGQSKYYAVVMAWNTKGMADYCQQYGTNLVEINPFAMVGTTSWGKKTRVC